MLTVNWIYFWNPEQAKFYPVFQMFCHHFNVSGLCKFGYQCCLGPILQRWILPTRYFFSVLWNIFLLALNHLRQKFAMLLIFFFGDHFEDTYRNVPHEINSVCEKFLFLW